VYNEIGNSESSARLMEVSVRHVSLLFRKNLAVLIAFAWFTAGCAHPAAFQSATSKFRNSIAAVVQSAKVYLVTLNKSERDAYLYQQLESCREITRNLFVGMNIAIRADEGSGSDPRGEV
jgi:hypothetical protein